MYLSLIFLGAVAVASAWPDEEYYETILQEGLEEALENHEYFLIPDGVCYKSYKTDDDYSCDDPSHVVTLRVDVEDVDASPDIKFTDNLREVQIWRKGDCIGDANVELDWSCGVVGDVEKDDSRRVSNTWTRIRTAHARVKSNRRMMRPHRRY